jgi:hypothetical protein
LRPGDSVRVDNASLVKSKVDGKYVEGNDSKFSFDAQVLRRITFINPEIENKILILIEIEIAGKEVIADIRSYLETEYPGVFERHPLTEDLSED